MAFDLGKALLRKGEYESARLTEFEFAETVRGLKALAAELELHPFPLLGRMAERDVPAALAMVADQAQLNLQETERPNLRCRALARARLIEERGDPSPIRLG